MANWCSTTYAFTGPEDQITDFHNAIQQLLEESEESSIKKTDFGNGWLGNLLDAHDIDHDEENIYCRGYISYLGKNVDETDIEGEATFTLETETAWYPMHEVFDTIINTHYPDIQYFYMAEEFGCMLFKTNDINGIYFPDKYYLEVGGCEELSGSYCPDKKTMLIAVGNVFNQVFHSTEEMVEYLEDAEAEGIISDYFYLECDVVNS